MKSQRRFFLGLLALSACQSKETDQGVVVNVTNPSAVAGIVLLRANVSNHGAGDTLLFPTSAGNTAITFPTALSITVPGSRSGEVDIAVDGLDSSQVVVANAVASVVLQGRSFVTVLVALQPGPSHCGNGHLDPGETCDDGNQFSGDGCSYLCQSENNVDASIGSEVGADEAGNVAGTDGVSGARDSGPTLADSSDAAATDAPGMGAEAAAEAGGKEGGGIQGTGGVGSGGVGGGVGPGGATGAGGSYVIDASPADAIDAPLPGDTSGSPDGGDAAGDGRPFGTGGAVGTGGSAGTPGSGGTGGGGGSCGAAACPDGCCSGEACTPYASQTTSQCGSNGQVCSACTGGKTCQNGQCLCPSGQVPCASVCVNEQSDGNNCGSCGHQCNAPTGGTALCSGGLCTGTCSAGQTVCGGGVNGGGACVDTARDSNNCGSCGHACGAPTGGSASCSGSSCAGACSTGQTVCGAGTNGGGTCHDITGDPNNCGACDRVCTAPTSGTASCSSSACKGSCSTGQTVCGGGVNGGGTCIDTTRDAQNCGSCSHVCSAPTNGTAGCTSGSCLGACTSSSATLCGAGTDGGGKCYELNTDLTHCGSCNSTTCDLCTSATCYRIWGNYTSFGSTIAYGPNSLIGWKVNVGAVGTLRKVGILAGSSTINVSVQVAIYADNGSNYPGTLITSATGTINGGRNEITITSGAILSATGYWLMVDYAATTAIMANTNGLKNVTTYMTGLTEGSTPPNPFPSGIASIQNYDVNNYLVVQ